MNNRLQNHKSDELFFKALARRLAPRWIGIVVALVMALSGLAALSLYAASELGYLPARDESADPADAASVTDSLDVEPNLVADDASEEPSDATSDDDETDDDTAIVYEIPESLRADSVSEGRIISMYHQLGLIETILPGYGLEKTLGLGRDSILDDSENRMSKDFKIDDELRPRVSFWFDVYSKYDSNHRIVHHSLYPWIVYKVIDVSMIINSDQPRHLWLRRQRADRLVKEETLKVRAALKKLSLRRDMSKMSETEKEVAETLKPLGGNLRKQALHALRTVRVQTGQRDFFIEGLRISSRYLGTMEKIFAAHGMPKELTRIPLVESSFNKQATSKVGASGIWQFMNGTGRKYMMVDGAIDERRSPFKATEAAARLLKENHLILHHSWPLAVTAWNHGPSGVRKAMAKAGSRDLAKIIARYRSRSFDFASSNFYSEFLGALYAERYSDEIFGELDRHPTEDLQAVKLSRSVRFAELLKFSGMTKDDFLAINPDLAQAAKRNLTIPRGFRLHIPEWALDNLDQLFALYKEKTKRES